MRIKSIEDLEPIIKDVQLHMGLSGRQQYVENYRGHSLNTYKLKNGLMRFQQPIDVLKLKEKKLFEEYISQVKSGEIDFVQEPYHVKEYKFIREWFFLYQAQHLGLKTRLMDWTMNWEIALLFAVNEEKDFGKDGQFWIFLCPRKYIINDRNLAEIYNTSPLCIDNNYMINSPSYQDLKMNDYIGEKRRLRQHGRFFVQPLDKGNIPMEEQEELKPFLRKYIIDGNSKERIKTELNKITKDWAYYRYDDNIENEIKKLNEIMESPLSFNDKMKNQWNILRNYFSRK
jgi:hypothetical protein